MQPSTLRPPLDISGLRPITRQRKLATTRTVAALVLREMTSTYGRSPGGYAWAILEPVAGIAMMSAMFALFLRSPPLGTNFAIFYASGLLPFMMFTIISAKVAGALTYSRQLLSYPRVTIIDALLARLILNAFTQLLVAYLIITGILLIYVTNTTLIVPRILLAFSMSIALGAGFGTLNCFLFTRFRTWQNVWSIITRPLLIISGVMFMFQNIPEPIRSYIWFNPLIHVTGMMRSAFYLNYQADYVSPAYVFGVSLVVGVTGLMFLRRYHRDILEQ